MKKIMPSSPHREPNEMPQLAPNTVASKVSTHRAANNNFVGEMNRIQSSQFAFLTRLEKERKRTAVLEKKIQSLKDKIVDAERKSGNGSFAAEDEQSLKKTINRLEMVLQACKVKLSVSRTENHAISREITELRQEKLLHVSIVDGLEEEIKKSRKKIQGDNSNIMLVNEKKTKAKTDLSHVKNKMVSDMENFRAEFVNAKEVVESTQVSILDTIRERLEKSTMPTTFALNSSPRGTVRNKAPPAQSSNDADIERQAVELLNDAGYESLDELFLKLQKLEDNDFTTLRFNQDKEKEKEVLEGESRMLDDKLKAETLKVEKLQATNNLRRRDIEKQVATIDEKIQADTAEYGEMSTMLDFIAPHALSLLSNIKIENSALDQQLFAAGINERSIMDFLGLLESRVNQLIELEKALQHEGLKRSDFTARPQSVTPTERHTGTHMMAANIHSLAVGTKPGFEEMEEEDSNGKVQPVNIEALMRYMKEKYVPKKVQ